MSWDWFSENRLRSLIINAQKTKGRRDRHKMTANSSTHPSGPYRNNLTPRSRTWTRHSGPSTPLRLPDQSLFGIRFQDPIQHPCQATTANTQPNTQPTHNHHQHSVHQQLHYYHRFWLIQCAWLDVCHLSIWETMGPHKAAYAMHFQAIPGCCMWCDPSPLGSYGFLIWGPLHRGHSQSFPARGMEVASLEPWLKIKATGDNSDNSNGSVLFRLPNGKTVNSFHKTQITLSNSPIYKPISLPKCPKLKIHPKAKLWAAKRLASPAVPN